LWERLCYWIAIWPEKGYADYPTALTGDDDDPCFMVWGHVPLRAFVTDCFMYDAGNMIPARPEHCYMWEWPPEQVPDGCNSYFETCNRSHEGARPATCADFWYHDIGDGYPENMPYVPKRRWVSAVLRDARKGAKT
jgi:hypothetical protein